MNVSSLLVCFSRTETWWQHGRHWIFRPETWRGAGKWRRNSQADKKIINFGRGQVFDSIFQAVCAITWHNDIGARKNNCANAYQTKSAVKNRSLRTACSQAAVFFLLHELSLRLVRFGFGRRMFIFPSRRPEAARRLYIKNTGEKGL